MKHTARPTRRGQAAARRPRSKLSVYDTALAYYDRGWCPVPQISGAKCPSLKWGRYQDVQPDRDDVEYWFSTRYMSAGIALVLGPAFNHFVIDIDGEEAHREYLRRLGGVLPEAPTALSGSRKPYKYHHYFRHPAVETNAKHTPWHPQLEFRGYRGIVVAPPSLHPSGNRYRWERGRSPDDLPLPEVPGPVLEALKARAAPRRRIVPSADVPGVETAEQAARFGGAGLSLATRRFLTGAYAHQGGWNDRLFRAAADMAGCGIAPEEALPLLLAGARPDAAEDDRIARRTVESAYSQERQPARALAATRGGAYVTSRGFGFELGTAKTGKGGSR